MTALAATDWTLTVTNKWREGGGKIKRCCGTLLLAGTNTYPDGGVPLPTKDKFGFLKSFLGINIYGVDASAGTTANYTYSYDKVNHKMFIYEEEGTAAGGPLLEADTAEVPGARTLNFEAWGE